MDKTQAAKLAQAYQWLAEGKEVEGRYVNENWALWDGWQRNMLDYRIKPASLLECWANKYVNGVTYHVSPDAAKRDALGRGRLDVTHVAVHMREVRDEGATDASK